MKKEMNENDKAIRSLYRSSASLCNNMQFYAPAVWCIAHIRHANRLDIPRGRDMQRSDNINGRRFRSFWFGSSSNFRCHSMQEYYILCNSDTRNRFACIELMVVLHTINNK